MNYYGLMHADTRQLVEKQLSTLSNPEDAVAEFSHKLGKVLTLEDTGNPPVYFMTENPGGGPNWVADDIPVFEVVGS